MKISGVCASCLLVFVSLVEGALRDISTLKETITVIHNFYRSHERAANMKELKWDPYLQSRAEVWSENCYFDHQRDGLGENLSFFWTNARSGLTPLEIMIKSCQDWWKEVNDWNWSTDCGSACHYTQMIWGTTERIGCALSKCPRFKTDTGKTYENADFFVCFYDPPGNFVGRYPYTLGEPCTQCDAGEFCTDGLCSKGAAVVPTQVNNMTSEAPTHLNNIEPIAPPSPIFIDNIGANPAPSPIFIDDFGANPAPSPKFIDNIGANPAPSPIFIDDIGANPAPSPIFIDDIGANQAPSPIFSDNIGANPAPSPIQIDDTANAQPDVTMTYDDSFVDTSLFSPGTAGSFQISNTPTSSRTFFWWTY